MNINDIIKTAAAHVSQNETLRKMLQAPYDLLYYKPQQKKYLKNFRTHGLHVLKEFTACMDSHNRPYVMFAGSMLGAIREHGFIKHDLDIDTAMWIDDFCPQVIDELFQAGFRVLHTFSIDNDRLGKELTFEHLRTGIHIDIFFFYPPYKDSPYFCDFIQEPGMKVHQRMPRRIELPLIKERKKVPFEDTQVYVPANVEELCALRYGPDYMTPNPNWNWKRSKDSTVEWREMIPLTTHQRTPKHIPQK